jgi:RNA polymerase sigma-70 factor (ECF subfamily)
MTVRQDPVRDDVGASGSVAGPPAAPPSVLRRGVEINWRDFVSVYDACYGDVARWVRALGGPPSDLADLVQEVFVVVHRRLPDFNGENLIAWLYRITSHQVRDYRRSMWIRHIFRRSVEVTPEVASVNPTQLMVLETREKQRRLEAMLSRLNKPTCTTFVLFEIEGYTAEEIAVIEGISINTVRGRIQRARKRLMEMIEDGQRAGQGKGNDPWSR